MERRLTTILAADIAGFSRLVGLDEEGTLAARRDHRAELIDPLIATHGGRIANTAGDSLLVEFPSAVGAVRCAVAIQEGMAKRNADVSADRHIAYRIGINVGDVVDEGGDLLGDGVNVAARLEALAPPGGIVLSRIVRDSIRDRLDLSLADLGEVEVKNIARPVHVFQVLEGDEAAMVVPRRRQPWHGVAGLAAAVSLALIVALTVWDLAVRTESADTFDEAAALARPTGATLAVLPFENLSGDPAQDYLSDGISEDIIVELGRFRDLNVLSRQSTSAYRGGAVDVREIGAALGADYVLEGSVRRAGERLRVTARLVETAARTQVWSGAFDEALSAQDLFDVQLRITERVAAAVGDADGAIKRIDARRARTKPPAQLSSYECSMYQVGFFDRADMQERVRDCILRVVEEEPDYWRGWAQLAAALRTDVQHFTKHYEGTHAEKLERALAAARKAVSLNPEAPRAHVVLGNVLLLMGDREGFFAAAEKALALGGDRHIEGQLGYWFVWTGRHELGAALLRRAIDLNPGTARETWHRGLADYHFNRGEDEAALAEYRKGAQPHYWWAVAEEVAILTRLGRTEEARAARDRLYALRPGIKIADIVWIYRRFQRPDTDTAKYVEAFREAGIPEGSYRPLDVDGSG